MQKLIRFNLIVIMACVFSINLFSCICEREPEVSLGDSKCRKEKSVDRCEYDDLVFINEKIEKDFRTSIERYQKLLSEADSELEKKFYALLIEWRKDMFRGGIVVSSVPLAYTNSQAYQDILKLGKPVLPLIIKNMEKGDAFLWPLVKDIAGVDVLNSHEPWMVPDQKIINLHLDWWESAGKKEFGRGSF